MILRTSSKMLNLKNQKMMTKSHLLDSKKFIGTLMAMHGSSPLVPSPPTYTSINQLFPSSIMFTPATAALMVQIVNVMKLKILKMASLLPLNRSQAVKA